jgi:hypothetical protein
MNRVNTVLTSVTGIWMCRGKDMNVMVMDVEGTDGRERGEDQVSADFQLQRRFSANAPLGF